MAIELSIVAVAALLHKYYRRKQNQSQNTPAEPAAEDNVRFPPTIIKKCFDPKKLLQVEAKNWVSVFQNLSPLLPVQMHMQPFEIVDSTKDIPDAEAKEMSPLFIRACKLLQKFSDKLGELVRPGQKARLKLRLSANGKFIHRNAELRRNIISCLHGEHWWLFVDSHGGKADEWLKAVGDDVCGCGFRSDNYSWGLSRAEMEKLAKEAPEGVTAFVAKIEAGDILAFDGRWWHATCYEAPVLNLFFTPGKDMQSAVKNHNRRMKMPKMKKLKLATVNMAKCAKLSSDWKKAYK